MIPNWKMPVKYIRGLVIALLVVMVVQYALITAHSVGVVFLILQVFCYLLLVAALFRGFIERSRLAWLVAQIMLTALFDFSLLLATISAVFAMKTDSLWIMVGSAVAITVLNGLLMLLLFVIPVRNYFRPLD